MSRRRDKRVAELRAQLGYAARPAGPALSRHDLFADEAASALSADRISNHAELDSGRQRATHPVTIGEVPPPPVLVVSGVHSWAGTSTVAVAVATAAAVRGMTASVDEYAGPALSGLGVACDAELGLDSSRRWFTGRRGGLTVRRLADPGGTVATTHAPQGPNVDVVVADTGLPWPAVAQSSAAPAGWPLTSVLASAPPLILVCRATVPSLRHAEAVLDGLTSVSSGQVPALAVLGPGRWPGEVTASIGPRVAALRERGRVVTVPLDKQLAIRGVTADPLPNYVTAAGRSLLQLFTPPPARTSTMKENRR